MNKPMDPDAVFNYCCSRLDVPNYVMTSRRNISNLSKKRRITALLLLYFTDLKYESIAHMIGRDRTTVLYYMKTFHKLDLEHIHRYNGLKKEISNLKVMEMR